MTDRYYADETIKRELLRKVAKEDEDYLTKKRRARLMQVIGFAWLVVGAMIIVYSAARVDGSGIFESKGVAWLVGIPPIVLIGVGFSMKNNALKDVGFPYNNRDKEYIEFFEDAIEFGYRDPKSRFTENMCVYTIFKENLTDVYSDDEVITLVGEGQFTTYDDFPSKRVNHEKSQKRFYKDTEFRILLDYKENNEIVALAKEMKER